MTKKVGVCFSKDFDIKDGSSRVNPLGHIVTKLPVYLRLLELCEKEGWDTFVLTRKTYEGNGVFNGVWKYNHGKFERVEKPVKIDLVYDRTAGVEFPPKDDESVIWVNRIDFKILAWDKWKGYQAIGKYMPQTLLVEKEEDIKNVVSEIKTDWVVLKPFNGLKGLGIYIGPKAGVENFKFGEKYKKYIAQEFVDTSQGMEGVTAGLHDLRVAIVNGKPVWCHVRVPASGTFLANAARGGNLTEVDYEKVPKSVKEIVLEVSQKFYKDYDNPIFSLDFGMGKDGKPYIFEINDQIGFPKWEMKNRDNFLNGLISNFKSKLSAK